MWIRKYQDLIWYLAITDLKIKYQNSVLGFAWSLINPLLLMLVLYFVFINVFRTQENFALYILVGIITWRFFANGTSFAMTSIINRPGLVTKIFIPRQILVLSTVLSCFISSFLEFLIMFLIILLSGVKITSYILFFPFIYIIYFLIVYGVSLILAALFVYYRDLNQIWEILLQIGFFLSPIVYPITIIPVAYLSIYFMNPITVLMEIYRNILLWGIAPNIIGIFYIVVVGVVMVILGTVLFEHLQRRFAEEI